jgi:hypothetical protein
MQRMKHPLDLPVTVLTEVLTVWLDIGSLLALDSASYSAVSRKAFLDVVGSVEFRLKEVPGSVEYQSDAMNWFAARRVKTKRLAIDGSLDLDIGVLTTFLHCCGDNVNRVRMMNFRGQLKLAAILGLVGFSSRRLKLVFLDACDSVDGRCLGTLLSWCSNASTGLEISNSTLSSPLSSLRLPELQMLHLYVPALGRDSIYKLINASPNLRSFLCEAMRSNERCFDALATHYPLLQVLSFEKCDPDITASLVCVLQSCPMIEAFDVDRGDADQNNGASDEHVTATLWEAQGVPRTR